MSESVGVHVGRVCPRCGREDSIPQVFGLPSPELMDAAEQGLVSLGGCMMSPSPADFFCRSCGLEWGSDVDAFVPLDRQTGEE